MSFKHCPNCGGLLRAPDVKAGHAVRCTKCGYTFAVPDHEPGGQPPRSDAEREERRRRHRRPTNGADTPKRELVLPTVLLAVGLGWGLFSFLFELAWYETLISLLIIGLIHFVAERFLVAVIISVLK